MDTSKEAFASDKAPAAIGPYSAVLKAGECIFVSGQIPIDGKTGEIPEAPEAQYKLALENLQYQLEAVGCSTQDVMKSTVYMTNLADYGVFNKMYGDIFAEPYPAREVVGVAALPKGVLIEISVIAMKPVETL